MTIAIRLAATAPAVFHALAIAKQHVLACKLSEIEQQCDSALNMEMSCQSGPKGLVE